MLNHIDRARNLNQHFDCYKYVIEGYRCSDILDASDVKATLINEQTYMFKLELNVFDDGAIQQTIGRIYIMHTTDVYKNVV